MAARREIEDEYETLQKGPAFGGSSFGGAGIGGSFSLGANGGYNAAAFQQAGRPQGGFGFGGAGGITQRTALGARAAATSAVGAPSFGAGGGGFGATTRHRSEPCFRYVGY